MGDGIIMEVEEDESSSSKSHSSSQSSSSSSESGSSFNIFGTERDEEVSKVEQKSIHIGDLVSVSMFPKSLEKEYYEAKK